MAPHARPESCPDWCVVRHAASAGGSHDPVHIGGALIIQRTVVRLCTTIDPDTGTQHGPRVLLGAAELSLHEAEALIAALTQLVDQGRASLLAQHP